MATAKKFPPGLLQTLPPQKLNLLIGEITALLMLSPTHRKYQLRDLADVILPPINLQQFKIYRNEKKQPIGLLTWGRLSAAVEARYLAGQTVLSEADLHSGDRLFFLDFLAPYGHLKQIVQHAKTNLFPNDYAQAVRFYQQEPRRIRILKFYGANYKKPLN
jgi:cytolysin-activating lysine-acyltransferase